MNIARATWTVPAEMTVFRKNTNNAGCEAWAPLQPHAKKCLRVWHARGEVYCLHTPSLPRESPFQRVIKQSQLHVAFKMEHLAGKTWFSSSCNDSSHCARSWTSLSIETHCECPPQSIDIHVHHDLTLKKNSKWHMLWSMRQTCETIFWMQGWQTALPDGTFDRDSLLHGCLQNWPSYCRQKNTPSRILSHRTCSWTSLATNFISMPLTKRQHARSQRSMWIMSQLSIFGPKLSPGQAWSTRV